MLRLAGRSGCGTVSRTRRPLASSRTGVWAHASPTPVRLAPDPQERRERCPVVRGVEHHQLDGDVHDLEERHLEADQDGVAGREPERGWASGHRDPRGLHGGRLARQHQQPLGERAVGAVVADHHGAGPEDPDASTQERSQLVPGELRVDRGLQLELPQRLHGRVPGDGHLRADRLDRARVEHPARGRVQPAEGRLELPARDQLTDRLLLDPEPLPRRLAGGGLQLANGGLPGGGSADLLRELRREGRGVPEAAALDRLVGAAAVVVHGLGQLGRVGLQRGGALGRLRGGPDRAPWAGRAGRHLGVVRTAGRPDAEPDRDRDDGRDPHHGGSHALGVGLGRRPEGAIRADDVAPLLAAVV